MEQTEVLMREKQEADAKYMRQKAEFEQLQQQLVGTSSQAEQERAQLDQKQQKLERERDLLVTKYES